MSYCQTGAIFVVVLVIANVSTSTLPLDSSADIASNGYGLRQIRQASSSICSLPVPPVTQKIGCLAYFSGYIFNNNTRRCESYAHSGCSAIKNLFDTKDACEKTCGGR
ncbi:unnamed protein product [Orchesella dallaii]|uniref:BPTI/Kunitz inhibitor domain-containing protein n=1 Tax=Orchesella dallaii TaxID=48710 RepID=A0ABP1Q739_9HEXA